jgi:Integrase core domain
VIAHPNAEWLARQLTEACGGDEPPRYLIRGRDGAYSAAFIRRIRAMGIRDRPVSARFALAERIAERLIGSMRRECLDHVVVVGERHLRHVLASYQKYYNEVRTHLSLQKDAPFGVMCAAQGACVRRRSWAGYTINMFEFEFPTGTTPALFMRMSIRPFFASTLPTVSCKGHVVVTSDIDSPSSRRPTKRRRSSISELAFHGICTSRVKSAARCTHVSGAKWNLCLGPLIGSTKMKARVMGSVLALNA